MTAKKNGALATNGSACGMHGEEPSRRQVVLVFQGGGALGAYQAGVYEALADAGIEPDWIIGTSIGAINAALIAGNEPKQRVAALRAFWRRVEQKPFWPTQFEPLMGPMSYLSALTGGIPGFFLPNPFAFMSAHARLGAERAGYYSTAPLEKTLLELVDFDRANSGHLRLTVGAGHVRSSRMTYFDSSREELGVKHVLASGALPPAFPAVRIDGELYWDGGILSNTPAEAVFDDMPRRDSLIFAVHMWQPDGDEPESMLDVAHRLKDIQYSSRVASHIVRQQQMHQLRHVITQLVEQMPPEQRRDLGVQELAAHGCMTQMHVVRLLAPRRTGETSVKDVDFSPTGIYGRWQAGYASAADAIKRKPWEGEFDPIDGIILHEPPSQSIDVAAKFNGAKAHAV
jgi:NTE family protein